MFSLWIAVAFEILGALCLLRALVAQRSLPLFSTIRLAAIGVGLMLAGLVILYVDLFPPPHSIP